MLKITNLSENLLTSRGIAKEDKVINGGESSEINLFKF